MNMGNASMQHFGVLAWDGAAPASIDVRRHQNFSWSFENPTLALTADTIFNVEAAPPSDADNCVPGAFYPVAEVLTCTSGAWVVPAPQATIMIPNGTPAGSKCSATIPCKPDAFVRIVGASGETGSVRVVMILSGPR
jgi:hypothetical protein